MLRIHRRQRFLQHGYYVAQSAHDADGRGVIGDDILGEDERERGEILPVDGEGVEGEGIEDLGDWGGGLGVCGGGVGGWEEGEGDGSGEGWGKGG